MWKSLYALSKWLTGLIDGTSISKFAKELEYYRIDAEIHEHVKKFYSIYSKCFVLLEGLNGYV